MLRHRKYNLLMISLLTILILAIATPAFGSDNTVRVWVEYREGQSSLVRTALKGASAQFHYQFDRLNSFVVTVPEKALASLERYPSILAIEIDPERYLVEPVRMTVEDEPDLNNLGQTIPWGIDAVQARDVWDADRDGVIDEGAPTGAGRTVCIIDTGFYDEHEDFQGVDVIGGISQVDGEETDRWNFDGYGHGTHVAGTITAMNNNLGVVGVTPGTVSLFIVKYFDDEGLWVPQMHASNLVAAAYLCADNGANVISMSLAGSSKALHEEKAFDDLYASGVLSVAAASNEGIDKYMYPASYDSVISVSAIEAIDGILTVADFSQFNDQVELAAPGVSVLSTVPFIGSGYVNVDSANYQAFPIGNLTGMASGTLVDGGLCKQVGNWDGAVVLCERGDITFSKKILNVEKGGGVAAVIYNNKPGIFFGVLSDGPVPTIVGVSISQEDGQYLFAEKLGEWAEVYAELAFPASGYESWGGTSMATPHVSGVAALIWSAYPNLSNVQIREAMDATAFDLGDPGRDVYYGYGLVQADDALQYLADFGTGQGPKGPKH